jgi:MarR family transcriptional regulator, organic hydroperoxide resistance regulator
MASTRKAQLTEREMQVAARVGELHDVDFNAMAAVSNIYRVASAVRNVMERDILAADGLSWTGFTALYVLWIWGPQEARHLADECGVTKGTLTGVVNTLVSKGLIDRRANAADGRLVSLALTPLGTTTIRRLFPRFNHGESSVVAGLTESEQVQLASLLRKVLRQAEQL